MRLVRPLFVVTAFFLAQCDRAPSEPIATATATAKQRTRCVRPTSDKAPPPVPKGPDPACPKDPDGKPPEVPQGKVTFSAANGASLDVELMLNEEHRERGLMYRRELAEDKGMLFVFPDADVRAFWMKNTCLPLDMLFIAEDGFVTGVLENVPTMNEDARSIPCPVKYVLEANSGWARRHGVKAGQKAQIQGIP